MFIDLLDKSKDSDHVQVITLPLVEANIFQIYKDWLYTGRLYIRDILDTLPGLPDDEDDGEDAGDEVRDDAGDEEYDNIYDCYVLGENIRDAEFKDALIDAMIEKNV